MPSLPVATSSAATVYRQAPTRELAASRLSARRWFNAIFIASLMCILLPSALLAATYRCQVTYSTPAGLDYTKEVEVQPFWFWQTPEKMAVAEAGSANTAYQAKGATISVRCWELKPPPTVGVIPVVYNYPSDNLKGVTLAYALPIQVGGAVSAGLRQGPGTAGISAPAALDFSLVGELGLTKANVSNAIILAGGGRVGKPFRSGADVFGQVLLGVTRFSGERDFTIKPEVGVVIPMEKLFSVSVVAGRPVIFFPGAHETGFEIGAGLVFPGRRIR